MVGSHVISVYDALADAPQIKHITVKHEMTASGMADAYGRLTGKPGVVLVTAGPGATNSLTGVAQAYMAASPVVHISGAAPSGASYESFHGVDKPDFLARMFAEVTKWSVAVERAEEIPDVLSRAFAIATSGRPGPVHVEIPQDIITLGETEMNAYQRTETAPGGLDPAVLTRLTALVSGSSTPVIWAGKGVRATMADRELAELAELLEAPVILAGDAAGSLPDTHPLSTGQLSLYDRLPLQRALASESDLILAIGERGRTAHADALFEMAPGTTVAGIWFGNDGESADLRSSGGAVADIKTALNQLLESCGDQQRAVDTGLRSRIERGKNGLRRHIMDGVMREWSDATPMHYGAALNALAEIVDETTICLGDIGSHNQWTRMVLQTLNRNTFIPEGYWGAMGFGLPAAMAAKIAFPSQRVVSVTGDGCFLMASSDFATAVEYGLNPVVVILNDRQYGMIVGMLHAAYGRSYQTELNGPDFVAFARSFGADGIHVDRPDQMRDALERGFASETIFVIDAACTHESPHYDLRRAWAEMGEEAYGKEDAADPRSTIQERIHLPREGLETGSER